MNERIANEFLFIIDESHYFVSLYAIQAFSGTIKRRINNKQPLLYQFDKLHDPLHQFSLFVDLLNGYSIDITDENAFFLGYIGDILEINQLSQATNSYRQIQYTQDNIFGVLNELGMLNISYPQAIDFAATNWDLLSKKKEFIHLPCSILNEIFSKNPKLSLDFDFVFEAIKANLVDKNKIYESEYISLFKFCDLSSFTTFQKNKLVDLTIVDSPQNTILQEIIPTLLLTYPSQSISNHNISSDSQRNAQNDETNKKQKIETFAKSQIKTKKSENQSFIDEVATPSSGIKGSRQGKPSPEPPKPSSFVNVEYEPGFELDGVVSMLQKYYQRPAWKDEVVINCSEKTKSFLKYKIFDFDKDNYWDNFDGESCKIENAWIVVGFPNYSLRLSYYTLAPKNTIKIFRPPKSWKIYGSNNIDNFDESDLITYVKEAPEMKNPDYINTFEVKSKPKPYSYFKIVMLENYAPKKVDAGDFSISALEFFGILTHL